MKSCLIFKELISENHFFDQNVVTQYSLANIQLAGFIYIHSRLLKNIPWSQPLDIILVELSRVPWVYRIRISREFGVLKKSSLFEMVGFDLKEPGKKGQNVSTKSLKSSKKSKDENVYVKNFNLIRQIRTRRRSNVRFHKLFCFVLCKPVQ